MFCKKCLLIVVIASVMLSLCPTPSLAAKEILVGATVSLEGRFQAPSKMMQFAYRLWEKQVNESGGLLGRPVRLIFYDDQSKKELVRFYYEKMILEDKVDFVLAPYGTTLSYEASEVTERHGFVLMACAASGEMIWSRGYRYVFGVYGIAQRYFIGFLDLAARRGLQSVAIINEDTLFTKDAAAGAVKWSRRMGLEVKLEHTYRDGAGEFDPLIRRLETLNPDALILCSYPPDGYLFLEKLSPSAFKPKAMAMTITPGLPDFAEKAGSISDGIYSPSHWEPDERVPFPGTQRFIKEFKAFSGMSPSYHSGAAYAGCQLLEESIKVHGEIDHQKIRDYISALDTVTVIGRFKVDTQGRQVGHNSIIVQWQNGKKEIVYPSKMQTSEPKIDGMKP